MTFTKHRFLTLPIAAILLMISTLLPAAAQDLYLISFTAEWCPNCKVLDPKMDEALSQIDDLEIEHLVLDMTNAETKAESFEQINGSVLAEVYGDHLGVTGIGILTAADSGEKIGCVNRTHSITEITALLKQALEIVQSEPALQRRGGLGDCPPANRKLNVL